MTRRHEQLEEVIRRTLQETLRKGIADPRVRGIVSIGHVKLAPDMGDATAFISAFPPENLELVLHGLKSATPHLRRDLARRANLRRTPRLWFKKDAGAAAAAEVTRRLDPNNDPNEGGREHGHDEENLGD
ncbi:MAG: ribosome-binding factor A [Phycisphaerae bacterium]|nr:ribosome-binding factor A [Phycisphaerae bacterium]